MVWWSLQHETTLQGGRGQGCTEEMSLEHHGARKFLILSGVPMLPNGTVPVPSFLTPTIKLIIFCSPPTSNSVRIPLSSYWTLGFFITMFILQIVQMEFRG